jgi:hypothetical protein
MPPAARPSQHAWSPGADELISLIPLHEQCDGVTTHGLLPYPLAREPLRLGDTRGVSNAPSAAPGQREP